MDPLPLWFSFKQTSVIKAEPPQFPSCATFSLAGGLNWMLGWEKLWFVLKPIHTPSVKWFCIISSSKDVVPSYGLKDLFFFPLPAEQMLFFFCQILLLLSSLICQHWRLVCSGGRSKLECRTGTHLFTASLGKGRLQSWTSWVWPFLR